MKYLSLFSGIGGFELGIGDSGICIGYSEIDKATIKTYEEHFTHENFGDITIINATRLPDFDLLVGGFPCQAFSVAGKRRGFEEARGTLFFDIARILKDKRPRHLLLENVKGLLNHDGGKTFQTILRVLTELGYGVEWMVLNSKDFGVPQNRERVYIVGHLGKECGRKIFPIKEEIRRTPEIGQHVTPGSEKFIKTRHLSQNGGLISDSITLQASEVPHLIENVRRGAPRTYMTNAPTVQSFYGTGGNNVPYVNGIRKLTPIECERLQGFSDNWTVGSDNQRYKQCGNAVTVNVVRAVIDAFVCL